MPLGSPPCAVCSKSVYLLDKIQADGLIYHKRCFKCKQCDRTLSLGNFAALEGAIYCKPHFKQLFKTQGKYDFGSGGGSSSGARARPQTMDMSQMGDWRKQSAAFSGGASSQEAPAAAPSPAREPARGASGGSVRATAAMWSRPAGYSSEAPAAGGGGRVSPRRATTTTHRGGCHCGACEFEFEHNPFFEALDCNCSICSKKGYLHVIVPKDKFKILKGEEAMQTYKFGTGTAKHFFCTTCGCAPFYIPRSNPNGVDVNMRCVDRATVKSLRVVPFDGQNWEQNAGRLKSLA